MQLTHDDLFSGIGGFTFAAQWAGFKTVRCVEINKFCQKIIRQTWPGIPVESDARKSKGIKSDLLTGGFPCQPFSYAGKRKGAADGRDLWPEMFRLISEGKPTWVVAENVAGFDGLGLDQCISNLETIGYEVAPPLEIPACSVGAIHRRNRIWIVAHSGGDRLQRSINEQQTIQLHFQTLPIPSSFLAKSKNDLPKPCNVGTVHGIPNRAYRIEAIGNSIVPQVAYQILKAIHEIEINS